jgi:hypothetical protein
VNDKRQTADSSDEEGELRRRKRRRFYTFCSNFAAFGGAVSHMATLSNRNSEIPSSTARDERVSSLPPRMVGMLRAAHTFLLSLLSSRRAAAARATSSMITPLNHTSILPIH